MSDPPRRSDRLKEKGKTLLYPKYNSTGEKEYQPYTAHQRPTEVISSHSSSSSDSEFQSVGSEAVSESSVDNTVVEDPSDVNEIAELMNKMEIDDKDYKKLVRKLKSIQCDIGDHFDEYPATEIASIDDINRNLTKIERLRTEYREIYVEVMEYLVAPDEDTVKIKEKFVSQKDIVLVDIKEYINKNNAIRGNIRQGESVNRMNEAFDRGKREKDALTQKIRTTNFLLDEVKRMITELSLEFSKPRENVSDEEIIRRNKDLSENTNKAEKLSKKFQEFLQIVPDEYPNFDFVVEGTKASYNKLIKDKGTYERFVKLQMQEREILKEESFKTSSLNIKLSPFSGYNSDLDIFSFQAQFEKLYLKTVSTKKLADLLKNNHLEDPALSLVRRLDDIKEIWSRLQKAYGDPRILLKNKLAEVKAMGPMWRLKDADKLKDCLIKLINAMHDLLKLSKQFNIEQKLYHGEAFDIIQGMMGEPRLTKWLTSISDDNFDVQEEDRWNRLSEFFEKELSIQQEKSLLKSRAENNDNPKDKPDPKKVPPANSNSKNHFNQPIDHECKFCGETGHVATNGPNRSKIVQYFACKKFCDLTCSGRLKELNSKGLCHQCLFPGAKKSDTKHATGKCQSDWICKHSAHDKFPCKKHVLVCQEHCEEDDNKKLHEEYVSRFITPQRNVEQFSKEIKLSFITMSYAAVDHSTLITTPKEPDDEEIVQDRGIYLLQQSPIDDKLLTYFYDGGCSDSSVRHKAIEKLGKRAKLIKEGPFNLGGVTDFKMTTPHGVYRLKLPLENGKNAIIDSLCLDKITCTFPTYPLKGDIEKDIREAFRAAGGDPNDLPSLPNSIGGDVDIMIGCKYNRYMPREIFRLPSGLAIYKSVFKNVDGSQGIIGGPHPVITMVEEQAFGNKTCKLSYFSEQYTLFRMGYQVNPDAYLLNSKPRIEFDLEIDHLCFTCKRKLKQFELIESVGSEIQYRCVECRKCVNCKNGEQIEEISLREEVEQDFIVKSVDVDTNTCQTTARLPLLHDPSVKLAPNKEKAMAIYQRIIKQLNKNPSDLADAIKAEQKLQDRGHVEYVKNLPPEIQEDLKNNPIQNFIPWHPVWNPNSISTSCRIVFDFSHSTPSSYSVNDLLAKGRNNMNKLQEIYIRWRTHPEAFHSDIEQMYPSLKLEPKHWCLQRYIFQKDLDPNAIPEEKVIMVVIYGAKSSGNQAEQAIRETARLQESEFPEASEIVHQDLYVDDCLSGSSSTESMHQRADELVIMMKKGGFNWKGFTFSGEAPPSNLTEDGESVKVAGSRWYSESDELQLDIGEISFAKKKRGKKTTSESDRVVPEKLTRSMCMGKVGEVYDLSGMFAPITGHMKIDLRDLTIHKFSYKDVLPDEFRQIWVSHVEMIKEISNVKFKRAVVPSDAASLDMNTVDAGDASKVMACAAIYVRFPLKGGDYSCELIFARTKLLPEGTTQPRAELVAAVLNTHTGEVVRRALSKHHQHSTKLTDSKIVLCWISNTDISLKDWTRSRVIEVLRFTVASNWLLVKGTDMVADIGTRRGATLADVLAGSEWHDGKPWMTKEVSEFPALKYEDITLSEEEKGSMEKEIIQFKGYQNTTNVSNSPVPEEVSQYYAFSNYIVDPNKHRFRDVVRLVAIIQKFIRNCRERAQARKSSNPDEVLPVLVAKNPSSLILSDEELKSAADYYYRKASDEIKQFVKKEKYENISVERDDILYYNGRVLPTQEFNAVVDLTGIMKDLTASTFCVPLVSKHSPLAYSLVNEVHWYDKVAMHTGVETNLRYVLHHAFIMEGREIVKRVKKGCQRCRYLYKRAVEVAMGPISSNNLAIAPPFYVCQIDVAGPFKAYSAHNKRTTIKVYYAVFCCTTTMSTNIKLLEDYSTSGFLLAFTRFACEVGYPKLMMIDEGSQLVRGCETMEFSFRDAQYQLNKESNVKFDCCPVGGHNVNGRVERRIRTIKESIEKSAHNERLSIIQWETLGASIANTINDLPIAKGNIVSNLEHLDLITPNRLKLGRNNSRSPDGPLQVTGDLDKVIRNNTRIFNAWFELWLISCVPKLMTQPKWFDSDRDVQTGDIVLFLKKEGELNSTYQYGRVSVAVKGRDDRVRAVTVTYRNHNENINRETRRTVRELIVIHAIDELNILEELGRMATASDSLLQKQQ